MQRKMMVITVVAFFMSLCFCFTLCSPTMAQTTITTTGLTSPFFPFGGFGHYNPFLYNYLGGSLDTTSLGSYPFFGMGGFGRMNPYLYSGLLGGTGLDTTTTGYSPWGMMGGYGCMNPYLYSGLFGTGLDTTALSGYYPWGMMGGFGGFGHLYPYLSGLYGPTVTSAPVATTVVAPATIL